MRFSWRCCRFGENDEYEGWVVIWAQSGCNHTTADTAGHVGLIRERNWYGADGMEHARTKKEPQQSIPTFAETVELLMKVGLIKFNAF